MKKRLLIVEDDLALRTGLQDSFEGEGFDVTAVSDGDAAHELIFSRHFDGIVLDLMLPGKGGLQLLREVREQGMATPVLLLTARGEENDKVLGLELGADDYVTKPFGIRELVARVQAMLRRSGLDSGGVVPRFRLGDAEVDLDAYQVQRDGTTHRLSKKEAAMLGLLHENRGKAVAHEVVVSLDGNPVLEHEAVKKKETEKRTIGPRDRAVYHLKRQPDRPKRIDLTWDDDFGKRRKRTCVL